MVWRTVAAKGRWVWHRLPPPGTIPLVLVGGLYWLLGLGFATSGPEYAAVGPHPALIWAELVGLPLLLGAQHLAAGLAIWRAAGGWGRPATRAAQRRALAAAAGALITLGVLAAAGLAAVGLLAGPLADRPTLSSSGSALWLVAALAVGGGHLAVARGVRRARRWARIAAAFAAVGYLGGAAFVILLILGFSQQPYYDGTYRPTSTRDEPAVILGFMVVALLTTGASTLALYGLQYDRWSYRAESASEEGVSAHAASR